MDNLGFVPLLGPFQYEYRLSPEGGDGKAVLFAVIFFNTSFDGNYRRYSWFDGCWSSKAIWQVSKPESFISGLSGLRATEPGFPALNCKLQTVVVCWKFINLSAKTADPGGWIKMCAIFVPRNIHICRKKYPRNILSLHVYAENDDRLHSGL